MHFNESKQHKSRTPLLPKSTNIQLKAPIKEIKPPKRTRKSTDSLSRRRESEECTFEPRTNANDRNQRSVDSFIKDQERHMKDKENKLSRLRQQIGRCHNEQMTGTPQVDTMSNMIIASQRSSFGNTGSVYERLSRYKKPDSMNQSDHCFSPKILSRSKSMVRRANVSNLLYQDALRRQEKGQIVAESERKQRDLMMSPKINRNTNALVLRKIWSELEDLVNEEQINPLVALSVLQELFNVDLNPNKNGASNQPVQKIVGYLAENDDFGVVKLSKLKQFITLVVLGYRESTSFSEQEAHEICDNFQYFYKNRVAKQRKVTTPEQPTFTPSTLQRSNLLASSHRQRTCQQLQRFIESQKVHINVKDGYTIQDLFIIDHMKRQNENEKKRIEKEDKQMEQCTFKPDTSSSKHSISCLKKKPKVTLKTQNKKKQVKTDYNGGEENIPNSQNDPSKSKSRTKIRRERERESRLATLSDNIRDVEKVIMRMSVGRQKREMSQSVMEFRDYPKDHSWRQYQRDMHSKSIQNQTNLKGYTTHN